MHSRSASCRIMVPPPLMCCSRTRRSTGTRCALDSPRPPLCPARPSLRTADRSAQQDNYQDVDPAAIVQDQVHDVAPGHNRCG
jgi:hypothetical protein